MHTLIALVGEQPPPNLIPLFCLPPEERPGRVQFLVSGHSKIRAVFDHLVDAIEQDGALKGVQIAVPFSMDAWNLEKARQDCQTAIQRCLEQGDSVTVNLTGGTKIMSLAAQQAAAALKVPALYVNTERQEIIHFANGEAAGAPQPFKAPISIETQLRAAGRQMRWDTKKPPVRAGDIAPEKGQFAQMIARNIPLYKKLIAPVTAQLQNQKLPHTIAYAGASDALIENACQAGHKARLWRWEPAQKTITVPDDAAQQFLTGGWLEIYALLALSSSGYFDDVLGNVSLKDFAGEMDVVAARDGQLAILECKTGRRDSASFAAAKIMYHQTIFGGPYAKSLFVLPTDEHLEHWQQALNQYEMPEPIYGAGLRSLADEVLKLLRV